jgi:tetratricopeptide (TPR) repeat protein
MPRTVIDSAILFFFMTILALGGAGESYPLIAAIVQTAAILIILLCLTTTSTRTEERHGLPITGWWLIGAFAAFLFVELAPLPFQFWRNLPGHALAGRILEAATVTPGWRSLTLDPDRTVSTALELLPGLALLVAGTTRGAAFRGKLVVTLLVMAFVAAIYGGLQRFAPGNSWIFPYDNAGSAAPGLFINRNHQATFLLIAMPLAASWLANTPWLSDANRSIRVGLAIGLSLVFAAAIVATTSRAGFLLIGVAAVSTWLILRNAETSLRTVLLALMPLSLIIGVAGHLPTVQTTLARFSQDEDARPALLANSIKAAKAYWPTGSGLGSFPVVYPTVEPHDELIQAFGYNAHNDYAETWLEGGAAALAVLAVLVGLAGLGTRRRFAENNGGTSKREAIAALAGLLILALHSTADYPLRMMSIMALAGLLFAMLLGPVEVRRRPRAPISTASRRGGGWSAILRRPSPGMLTALALLLLLLPVVWAQSLSQQALARGDGAVAMRHDRWSSDALTLASSQALEAGRADRAQRLAQRAVALSPMNARAAGTLILALQAQNRKAEADRLLGQASALGWREPRILYLLMMQANDRNDADGLIRYMDALLRTQYYVETVRSFMLALEPIPVINTALAEALTKNPPWRSGYLTALDEMDERQIGDRVQLLEALAKAGAPPTSAEIDALLNYLVKHERFDDLMHYAIQFRRTTGDRNLLTPGEVAALGTSDAMSNPFAWRTGDALGVVIAPGATGDIAISSRRTTVGRTLLRRIVAPTGPLLLSGRVRENRAESWQWFNWSLQCIGSGARLVPDVVSQSTQADGEIVFEVRFTIPAEKCPMQDLVLGLNSGLGSGVDVSLLQLSRGAAPQREGRAK